MMRHIGLSFEQWAATALLRLAASLMRLTAQAGVMLVDGSLPAGLALTRCYRTIRLQAFERVGGGFWAYS